MYLAIGISKSKLGCISGKWPFTAGSPSEKVQIDQKLPENCNKNNIDNKFTI
jgi:hypothetical protein